MELSLLTLPAGSQKPSRPSGGELIGTSGDEAEDGRWLGAGEVSAPPPSVFQREGGIEEVRFP